MVIDRVTTQIKVESTDDLLNKAPRENKTAIQGIIGILNVCGTNYLGVITSTEKVGTLNNANINKVTGVKLLRFGVSIVSIR